jgi:hypothetical protein
VANYSAVEARPGQQWGKWTILAVVEERDAGGNVVCEVRCECGNEATVKAHRLVNGVSTQCRSCAQKRRRESEANVVDFPTKNPVKRGPSKWEIERERDQKVRDAAWLLGCAVTSYVRARDDEEREAVKVRIDRLREELRDLGEDDQAVVTTTLERIEEQAERRRQRLSLRR